MSASSTSAPPGINLWDNYLDLDRRAFVEDPYSVLGHMFTQNDRSHAHKIIRTIIEKNILPFAI